MDGYKEGDIVRVTSIPSCTTKCGNCYIGEKRVMKATYSNGLMPWKLDGSVFCSAFGESNIRKGALNTWKGKTR